MRRYHSIRVALQTSLLPKCLKPVVTAVLLLVSMLCAAQAAEAVPDSVITVTGVVRDAQSKLPLPAVTLRALINGKVATTDSIGQYSIQVSRSTEVLSVTAFDYILRLVSVKGNRSIDIELYPDVFSETYKQIETPTGAAPNYFLNQSSKTADNGVDASIVFADEAIANRLGGDVRSINRSGTEGIGAAMFIRGYNSINVNAQPLIVVDGVIWNTLSSISSVHDGYFINNLANIEPSDIESVTVVKDAVSIYGSKAANGVIIVKTKRGKNMATKINFNAMFGSTEAPESLPMMSGDQFRIYAAELYASKGLTNSEFDDLAFLNDNPSKSTYKTYHNNTNWDDQVYEKGTWQRYNIGVTGGDDKALYAFTLGYTGNNGVVKSTDLQRLNTRFNADFNLSKLFSMVLNVGFSSVDKNLLDDGANYYSSPSYLAAIKAPFLNPYTYTASGTLTSNPSDADMFGVGNPTGIISGALNFTKSYRFNISGAPTVNIMPGLKFTSLFDYSLDKVKENNFLPMKGSADRYLVGYGVSENRIMNQVARNNALFSHTTLNYQKTFDNLHRVEAIYGFRYISEYYELDYEAGHNTGTDEKRNMSNDVDFPVLFGINDRFKSAANYLSGEYGYDNRLFFRGVVSLDASSRFGQDAEGGVDLLGQKWGVFPSANAAWLVSSETFMANVKTIDQLKLRVGYGLTGNDAIQMLANTPYFISERYMDRASGLVLGNIANTELKWETTAKLNAGIDIGVLNNRLFLSADVFQSKTSDLLSLQQLPEIVGPGYYWQNGGELSNTGYEVVLNAKLLNMKSFKWEMTGTVGSYKNKVESLPYGSYETSAYGATILTAVGNPAGVFYGYKTNGVYASEAQATAANLQTKTSSGEMAHFAAGDVAFVDTKADGIIDANDRVVIGDPNPDFYGSVFTKFTVKRFSLSGLVSFSVGNDVYNGLRAQLESGSALNNQTSAMLTRWMGEGQQTKMPKAIFGDPMGNARFSDRWIEDGSYLRLKDVTLNYNVPYQGKIVTGINVWASAKNLVTITDYLGRDPEFSVNNGVLYQGIDYGLLPQGRSFFFGINLNL